MKNYFVLIVLCVCMLSSILIVKGQSILSEYKKFDIADSSSEILYAVNMELDQKPTGSNFRDLKIEEQNKYPLKTKEEIDSYISSFNNSLEILKKQNKIQESMWRAENELRKYGVNVLSNYAGMLPSKHVTNFLIPAIQQAHELYVDDEFRNKIAEHGTEIDKMIVNLTNILYTKGIDITTANDETAFNNLFSLAHKKIPSLSKDEYAIFNKELTKRAYDFIKKNRADTGLLNVRVNNYRESVRLLSSQVAEFQLQITQDVTKNLSEVGNSITVLTKNQNEVFQTLDNIQQRILVNNIRINKLEHEMMDMQSDVALFRNKQEEHSSLIAQNTFQIDILSGYAFQNLDTRQKLEGLAKGHFDKVFPPEYKEKLINELKEIRTKETIISVAADVEQYSSAIYGGLVNSGVLKGKDAENAGKFMSAVSILSGAARIYAGDASGLASVVTGIGGFSGKSKPSAEMQMLQKMMVIMNERFDRIDDHLVKIESKIDNLTDTTLSMYKMMSLSFQFTFDQMDRIIWKTDVLNGKATALLYRDYEKCSELTKSWKVSGVQISAYRDYQNFFIQECQQCLRSLSDFPNNDVYFYVSSNENLKNESEIEFEIKGIYSPTRDLFYAFYGKDLQNAVQSLMFPFSSTRDSNKPYYYLSAIEGLKVLDQKKILDELFNYDMINEFTNFSLLFSNFFLLKGGDVDFKPLKLSDYLKNPNNKINKDLVEKRFLKLLTITGSAIAQQSLLAGHMLLDPIYSSLFDHTSDKKNSDMAIKVLNSNKLLAVNFSTHLINYNIKMTDTLKMKKLFESALSDDQALDHLNRMISVNDIEFISDKARNKLFITFTRNGQKISLQTADSNTIIENKMINTDAAYSLSETRQKINRKLIDLALPKNFAEESKNKFKYYYPSDRNNISAK